MPLCSLQSHASWNPSTWWRYRYSLESSVWKVNYAILLKYQNIPNNFKCEQIKTTVGHSGTNVDGHEQKDRQLHNCKVSLCKHSCTYLALSPGSLICFNACLSFFNPCKRKVGYIHYTISSMHSVHDQWAQPPVLTVMYYVFQPEFSRAYACTLCVLHLHQCAWK